MLKFSPRNYLGEEDFMVAACNETAYRAVKIWPYWQHFSLCVYGPGAAANPIWHISGLTGYKKPAPPDTYSDTSRPPRQYENINKLANENDF